MIASRRNAARAAAGFGALLVGGIFFVSCALAAAQPALPAG